MTTDELLKAATPRPWPRLSVTIWDRETATGGHGKYATRDEEELARRAVNSFEATREVLALLADRDCEGLFEDEPCLSCMARRAVTLMDGQQPANADGKE